jgi:hypothetical protein
MVVVRSPFFHFVHSQLSCIPEGLPLHLQPNYVSSMLKTVFNKIRTTVRFCILLFYLLANQCYRFLKVLLSGHGKFYQ